ELIGFNVGNDLEAIPIIEAARHGDESEKLAEFIRQWGGMIDTYRRAGIDVLKLAGLQAARQCRMSRYRQEKRLKGLIDVSPQRVVALAIDLLQFR
ncbi:MAG TPA: hypothetical protein VKA04_10725, partial [Pseudodesulfovibrio sp.]|nr:hypothetical protein [Pseudodesulfovibrio sp.]